MREKEIQLHFTWQLNVDHLTSLKRLPTQIVHVCQSVCYLFEVADAAHSQGNQQLEAGIDGSRRATHWDGLLCGELPTLHVLQVNIRRWEDEVINQLLIKKRGEEIYKQRDKTGKIFTLGWAPYFNEIGSSLLTPDVVFLFRRLEG